MKQINERVRPVELGLNFCPCLDCSDDYNYRRRERAIEDTFDRFNEVIL